MHFQCNEVSADLVPVTGNDGEQREAGDSSDSLCYLEAAVSLGSHKA